MSGNFGIRQSFYTQPISRKMAKNSSSNASNASNVTVVPENNDENIFENGNNYFINNVLNRSDSNSVRISSSSSSSSSSVSNNNSSLTSLSPNDESNGSGIRQKMVSARLNTMLNYKRAVTKSADHF